MGTVGSLAALSRAESGPDVDSADPAPPGAGSGGEDVLAGVDVASEAPSCAIAAVDAHVSPLSANEDATQMRIHRFSAFAGRLWRGVPSRARRGGMDARWTNDWAPRFTPEPVFTSALRLAPIAKGRKPQRGLSTLGSGDAVFGISTGTK